MKSKIERPGIGEGLLAASSHSGRAKEGKRKQEKELRASRPFIIAVNPLVNVEGSWPKYLPLGSNTVTLEIKLAGRGGSSL